MEKILVIEDNNEINQMIRSTLKDFETIPAFSGTEGIMILQKEKIDLVLLDIMLPGINGEEALKKIRQISQVPVIMLTALDNKKNISKLLLSGANDYMTKPFDFEELIARVTVQLRQPFIKQELPHLCYKNIRLLEESFEIEGFDKRVRLGRKEFEIFKCLLKNPTQIFTKEQLYVQIWKESYFPTDNTLNSHLSNLRKKIMQLDSNNEYIETIWGLGVRLSGNHNE